MKSQTLLILLVTVFAHMPVAFAAENLQRLEKAAERNSLKADEHNLKAEKDVAENKPVSAIREAKKAAIDEIKADEENQRIKASTGKSM